MSTCLCLVCQDKRTFVSRIPCKPDKSSGMNPTWPGYEQMLTQILLKLDTCVALDMSGLSRNT